MKRNKFRNELFVSNCRDMSHQMVVSTYDNKDEIFVSIRLNRPKFFSRVNTALKYVFGRPCQYGEFDDVILKKYDAERLRDAIDRKLTQIDNLCYGKRKRAKRKEDTETGVRKTGR